MDTTCWLPLSGDIFAVVGAGEAAWGPRPCVQWGQQPHLGWAGQGQPGDRHAVSRRLVPGQVL